MIDPVSFASLTYLTKGITQPVANELGKMAANHVKYWRASNLLAILKKADGKLKLDSKGEVQLNPKVLIKIAELGSLEPEPELQDMWAGLIASSSNSDSNLLYVDILSGLSKGQALLLKYACQNANVLLTPGGLVYSPDIQWPSTKDMQKVFGSKDLHEFDQALDDLRRKGLIEGGLDASSANDRFRLQPTALALHFFARVSGSSDSVKFFKLSLQKAIDETS